MAEGMFSHLINVIWKSIDAKKVEQETIKTTASIQQAAQQLQKTKITTVFDKEGLATGKKIEETFAKTRDTVKKTTPLMDQFGLAMRRALIVAPVWMIMRGAMMSVFNLIRSQIKFLRDMEDAMARIKIVGKGTAEQYEGLKYSLIGLSLAYGISASEAMKAAVIFAQQGYTVSDTLALTRAAMIGAQVLGEDVKETVESLTAAMKAFQIPIEQATSIIDKLIAVEKEFAVTSKDLAAGIKVTGATASMVGISLEALVGDITAVVEVTRKSGAEAARGLQFIYARLLTTAKPVIEQLTGIKFYLDAQGKSTHALTGKLRTATDILDELAGKWANLSNEERLNIAVATGSKRQLVTLSALMLNYAHSIDARIAALTSAGQAEKALAIIQDTVTYKAEQLTAAWNTLTVAVADTSAWKGMLDITKEIIIGLTALINFQKAYRVVLAQQVAGMLAEIETRKSQIDSITDLIKLRNKLLAEPPTDKTTERLEKINKAIEATTKEHPAIKIALETGKPEELDKVIKEIEDKLLVKEISLKVFLEYEPQLKELENERKKLIGLEEKYSKLALERLHPDRYEKIAKIEKKIAETKKKQTEEEEKQLILAKAQRLEQEIIDEEEELNLSGKLTEKEEEQLAIERELIRFKLLGTTTTEQQIQKEIELIKNSKTIYDIHERNLKLEQLQNQLVAERLRLKEEERNKMASLAIQYEKAGALERDRIKRATELMRLTPKELAGIFEEDLYDRNLILEYWSSFSNEAQRAIEDVAMRIADIAPIKTDEESLLEALDRLKALTKTGISFKGAEIIAPPPAISPIINQQTMIEVGNIVGAIDRETLERILNELREKIKASPYYIDDNIVDKIIDIIGGDEHKQQRLGKTLSDNI